MEWIAQRIGDSSSDPFKYIAVGTGLTPASPTDTSLQNEVDRVLSEITINQRQITYVATFVLGSYDLSEFGLFDAATDGIMFSRYCTGSIIQNKPATSELKLQYQITV
ncbi:MAG TPA: hypothetical protein EYP30_05480 [Archaeoglobaceae archaeon]|nr:hypothetical protein [Archaeoglobaceae archaeon]